MRQTCAVSADDGMVFDASSITVGAIREEARYGGLRVRLIGTLGKARSTVQLDVGYGDAIRDGLHISSVCPAATPVRISKSFRGVRARSARANLSADQYAKADKAHMTDGAYVKVAGKLHP